MSTARFRRSSVLTVYDAVYASYPASVSAELFDALWAVLWNRHYNDVDEPVWAPDASFGGTLTFARALDEQTALAGIDTLQNLLAVRALGPVPPAGSRVRVVAGPDGCWRLSDVVPLGLGLELRFDDPAPAGDAGWIATLRDGVGRLRAVLDSRRDVILAQRAQLTARSAPPALETIWNERVAAIVERAAAATNYFTHEEMTALAQARSKGPRAADEAERRLAAVRKQRFTRQRDDDIARFRAGEWTAISARAEAELRAYAEYREEATRAEEGLQRVRVAGERAARATTLLDALERSEFPVHALRFDAARLGEPDYADELLRSIELLHAAIPLRARPEAVTFSAYRARVVGPAVSRPRL